MTDIVGQPSERSPGEVPAPGIEYRTVLVPLDGSPLAEKALPTATWLARRLGADLHVIAADVQRAEAWWYANYLDGIVEAHPGVVPHHTDDVDVADAIQVAARHLDPTVVCLATHGRSRSAAFVGSTFARIAAASRRPLVAVGARCRPTVDEEAARLVACVDGRPAAEAVLPDAAAWARRLGMGLTVVTVAEPTPPPIVPDAHHHRAYGPEGDPERYVRDLIERPDLAAVGADAQVIWDPISPHAGVLDHLDARPATMVAVASHVRSGIARVVLGSEAARIIQGSPVPVLVHPLPHH